MVHQQQKYYSAMRTIQEQPQQRKRIKTEILTTKTSPVISSGSGKNKSPSTQQKLPSLYTKPREDQKDREQAKDSGEERGNRKLKMIYEDQTCSENSYWDQINNRRNTLSLSHHRRRQIEKAEKIYGLLCKPQSQPILNEMPQQIAVKSSNCKTSQHHAQVYEKAKSVYQTMKKKKKTKDLQQIINLMNVLKPFNNLLVKLDDMLSLILFKKGKIYDFDPGFTVYSQNQLQNSLLIILWGEVKLKEIYRNKIRYCIPGDMLCEEILLDHNSKKKYFSQIGFCKGSLISMETAKTVTNCGLLEVNKEVYDQIKGRFIENGQKDKIMMFQHMLAWSLSKKMKLRK